MKYSWLKMIGLFILLILCGSCSKTQPLVNDPQTPENQTVQNTAIPNTPTVKEQTYSYQTVEIHCDPYIQTTWGNGPGEIGYGTEENRGPYPLQVDEQGIIYIPDNANNRILIYENNLQPPAEINLPESYYRPYTGTVLSWTNIDVSHGRIYLRYYKFKNDRLIAALAVFSTKGEMLQDIDLDAYYPYNTSVYLNTVLADNNGGVYLLFELFGAVHFDATYRPTLYNLNYDWKYLEMTIGWNRKLYTYHVPHEELWDHGIADNNIGTGEAIQKTSDIRQKILWDQLGIKEDAYIGIVGADEQEYIYLDLWGPEQVAIARISHIGERIKIIAAPLSDKDLLDIGSIALAPDGSLYVFSYDTKDLTKDLLVLKCQFNSDFTK